MGGDNSASKNNISNINLADIEAELPDILALKSTEVTIPTLNMNSAELGDISLSGLINTIISPPSDDQVVQVDPNTIQGQNQSITFHLQPMEDQVGPIRDVHDNIQGFPQQASDWNQELIHQTILEPKVVEQKPFVRILEQPASHKLRYRYKCEGRGAGALQGERSTTDKKSFPKIQIVNYTGPAVVVVSCVTHDSDPPKTHPHNLVSPASVGRDGCKKGVCTMNINNEDMTVEFPHLGIQCVRKKDIAEALKLRQEIRVDPFRQGFDHVNNPNSIDLNAVKLCFQVFLENPATPGKYTVILPPICSKPIYDAKAKKELQIMDMSDNTAPADGGKKIIILCEKVSKEDIKVRFYDYHGWEEWADFGSSGVHKQYAISLTAPRYHNVNIREPVRVCVELVKPSDDSRSEEEEFFYTPLNTSPAAPAPGVKRETVLRNIESKEGVKNAGYHGGGCVTEVKMEDSTWKQMTSQAGQMINKQRVDPYSKVVMTEGNLGLCSSGYEYNIPVTSGQYHFTESQSPSYSISQPSPDSNGLANLNLASPDQVVDAGNPPNVTDSDLVKILGLQDDHHQDTDMDNLSDKLGEFSMSNLTTISPVPASRAAGSKRSSREAENDSASRIIPRQMERQQSSIQTPNVSSNLSDILQNCKQINDL